MAKPLEITEILDTVPKIVSYCYLIRRRYETMDTAGSRVVPKTYPCASCGKKVLIHILKYGDNPETWVCPNCGVQDGPGEQVLRHESRNQEPAVKPTVNVKVKTVGGLVARAKKEGLTVTMDTNERGEEVNRPKLFSCPKCSKKAEELGKPYRDSMIEVTGKHNGYCCTRVMAPFGSECGGWYYK